MIRSRSRSLGTAAVELFRDGYSRLQRLLSPAPDLVARDTNARRFPYQYEGRRARRDRLASLGTWLVRGEYVRDVKGNVLGYRPPRARMHPETRARLADERRHLARATARAPRAP